VAAGWPPSRLTELAYLCSRFVVKWTRNSVLLTVLGAVAILILGIFILGVPESGDADGYVGSANSLSKTQRDETSCGEELARLEIALEDEESPEAAAWLVEKLREKRAEIQQWHGDNSDVAVLVELARRKAKERIREVQNAPVRELEVVLHELEILEAEYEAARSAGARALITENLREKRVEFEALKVKNAGVIPREKMDSLVRAYADLQAKVPEN
jgi:hypothetical protein